MCGRRPLTGFLEVSSTRRGLASNKFETKITNTNNFVLFSEISASEPHCQSAFIVLVHVFARTIPPASERPAQVCISPCSPKSQSRRLIPPAVRAHFQMHFSDINNFVLCSQSSALEPHCQGLSIRLLHVFSCSICEKYCISR